ncbi:MAG: MFS transporter [Gammaproteobacteria bacterium]
MISSGRTPAVPYYRLSGFYLFYFATLGAFLPYWSPYLKSIGFDAASIGQLTAILAATKIIAPNIWGWIGDHHGQRIRIIRLASLLACMSFAGMLVTQSFGWMALIFGVFGFFWNAALPQFEAITLTHLGESSHSYTRIRIWGSIGFIVTVLVLGKYFESHALQQLPGVVFILLFAIVLASMAVPERAAAERQKPAGSLFSVLRQAEIMALFAVCFLMQFSHAPYYTFYSIYLDDHGYSPSFVGSMWAISVVAEVAVFFYIPQLIAWAGLRLLLLTSLAITCVRWLIIAYSVDVVTLVIAGQLMHAATFGIYHAAAIQLIHRHFTGRLQGRGQALYSSVSFGVGLSAGSLMVGYSWNSLGSVMSFQGAALASFAALLIAWRWIRN